jgi:CBS domain-containing protein
MRISDILRQKGGSVVTIEADKTVHDAISKLNEHGIGALIVTGEGGEIGGIITERDVLRECGERCTRLTQSSESGGDACPAMVRDAMTKDLVIGVPDDDLKYVMGIMSKNRVRHLPVVDDGELVGIISIGDVVNAHVDQTEFENRQLKDYIQGVSN